MRANELEGDQAEAGSMAEAVPEKVRELAKFLGVDVDDIEEQDWGNYFEVGNEEYRVMTDEEADEAVKEYIEESVWSFNTWFIIDHSKLPYEATAMLESFQGDKCEDANDTILALIEDLDEFVKDAVSADGRGHFLSGYDGVEEEISIMRERENGIDLYEDYLYIYRTN